MQVQFRSRHGAIASPNLLIFPSSPLDELNPGTGALASLGCNIPTTGSGAPPMGPRMRTATPLAVTWCRRRRCCRSLRPPHPSQSHNISCYSQFVEGSPRTEHCKCFNSVTPQYGLLPPGSCFVIVGKIVPFICVHAAEKIYSLSSPSCVGNPTGQKTSQAVTLRHAKGLKMHWRLTRNKHTGGLNSLNRTNQKDISC